MQNSLSLSAKDDVGLTQNDVISTKKLAEQLNTSSKVILENARKCLPNKNIENGKPTFWNKAEITILIDCLKNNSSNHASDLYFESKGTISTDLTPALKIKKAILNKNTFTGAVKTITTKELAEVLGVSNMAIMRILEKTNNLNGTVKVENGKVTRFTEEQATLIKQEIQKHHNLQTRQIDSVSTELEENQTIANAMMILQRRSEELKRRAEIAEAVIDRISNGKGCYSMNQTAKALKLPYGNITLFEKLRAMQILNQDNTPKQEQINSGHFKVVVKFINEKIGNKTVTLTTGKGLVYLAKKFNTEIDESVQADA